MISTRWEVPINNRLSAGVGALLLAVAALSAQAQTLNDPTAPPDALLRALEQAQTQLSADESSEGDAASEQTSPDPAPASPNAVIQRLKKGQWQRVALIGGNRREKGERTERGTIESITMDQVRFERDGEPSTARVYKHDVVKERPGDTSEESNNNEQ
ncbi:hypothetical protein V6X02_09510 [Spiribacter sp. 1M153]|uniref:hypothetical protein n=1 Tax=Spiribacter roseus TaxID=1855875 RepID=UPI00349F4AF4